MHDRSSTCQVAPFGHLRIKVCLQLPAAFRSLPRPSSSLRAKASPVRPYLLPTLQHLLKKRVFPFNALTRLLLTILVKQLFGSFTTPRSVTRFIPLLPGCMYVSKATSGNVQPLGRYLWTRTSLHLLPVKRPFRLISVYFSMFALLCFLKLRRAEWRISESNR